MKLENKKGEYLMALVDLTSVTTGSIGTNTNFIVEENKVLKRISQSSLLKTSAISTTQVNSTTNVPSSSLVYSMNQSINKLNSELDNMAFNGTDLTLDELLDHYSVYNLPYIFGINYTSDASPDKNNTICIAIRNSIFAFSYSGKIFLANYGSNGWREINYMQSSTINDFDFNNPTYDSGSYRLGSNDHILNSPSDSLEYGNVLIIKQNDYKGADTLAMLAFPFNEQGTYYYKSGNYKNWQSGKWFKFQGTPIDEQ